MAIPILGIAEIGLKLIDQLWTSDEERDEKKLKLMALAEKGDLQRMMASSNIVLAEAQSEHWLTASWRPIVMLFLTALVGLHWLGYTPENMSEATVGGVLDIIQVALGGYVIGRSAEKTAKVWREK